MHHQKGQTMKTLTREERSIDANRVQHLRPPVNIFETKDNYVLEAEMPGVTKDGVEITVEGNELVIIGKRNGDAAPGELYYRESRPWDYRRVFELDPTIDTSKINAKVEQGVLTLTLPKAEEVKPKRIAVTD
jgi:HSP20 family protein